MTRVANAPETAAPPQRLYCSFCGKHDGEVDHLIVGPATVVICYECIDVCNDILATKRLGDGELARHRTAVRELAPQLARLREHIQQVTDRLVQDKNWNGLLADWRELRRVIPSQDWALFECLTHVVYTQCIVHAPEATKEAIRAENAVREPTPKGVPDL